MMNIEQGERSCCSGTRVEEPQREHKNLRLLHVDDSEDFLYMFQLRFKDHFDIVSLSDSRYETCVKPVLETEHFDVIVMDFEMPLNNGLSLLKSVKSDYPGIPVVFYTGQGNEEIAREAFISGASDYFVKNVREFAHKEKLINSINRSVEKRKADEELKRLYEQMEQQVKERTAELTRVNETLLVKQQQQKALLDSIPDIAWLKDREGRFIGANQPFAEAAGVSIEELIGKTDFDIWPPEFAEAYQNGDRQVIESRRIQLFEEPHYDRGGKQEWVETIKVPIFNESEEVIGTAGISRDITERRKAQNALLDSKNFLDKIINSIPDPVFVKDREHRWILLNDAVYNFMGYKREDLLGKSDFDFFPPQEAEVFWEKDELVLNTGEENENEEQFTDAQGVTHTIITKKSLYIDSSGEKFIVGVIRDLTERIQAEAALRQTHNDFIYLLTHDLKNPVNMILHFCLLAREKPEQFPVIIEKVNVQATTMLNLIDNLLKLSKAGRIVGEMTCVDINPIIDQVYTRLKPEGIPVDFRIENRLPCIEGNPHAYDQIFCNLIENAILYRDPEKECLKIEAGFTTEDSRIVIFIKDNGSGIRAEDMERIFEPGYSLRKNTGTGFGLAIARRIIEAMGGNIRVESAGEKQGATFLVKAPPGKPAKE